jgi:hypothetical protein
MFRRAALSLALFALLSPLSVRAADTTTSVTLSSTAYTDLGAGPMYLGAGGGAVIYQIATSQPAASSAGLVEQSGDRPAYLQTTAHVWAIAGNTGGIAVVSTGTGIAPVNVQGSSSSTNANSHAVTGALATSLVLKPSAGNLYSVNATAITGGAAGFLVIVNATSAPAPGAITPIDFCFFSAGLGGCSLFHGNIPINYSTGIVALITSAATPYTYTTGVDTAAISGDYQ